MGAQQCYPGFGFLAMPVIIQIQNVMLYVLSEQTLCHFRWKTPKGKVRKVYWVSRIFLLGKLLGEKLAKVSDTCSPK